MITTVVDWKRNDWQKLCCHHQSCLDWQSTILADQNGWTRLSSIQMIIWPRDMNCYFCGRGRFEYRSRIAREMKCLWCLRYNFCYHIMLCKNMYVYIITWGTCFPSVSIDVCECIYRCDLNTLRPRQNGRHFTNDTVSRIFVNENVKISIEFSPKFVQKSPINNIRALVQMMATRRPSDKPLSEPMMASLLTHICVTRLQWINPYQNV